jgi:hypothetical protein
MQSEHAHGSDAIASDHACGTIGRDGVLAKIFNHLDA